MENRTYTVAQSTISGILLLDISVAKTKDQDLTSVIAGRLFEIISGRDCQKILLDLKGISLITSDVIGQLIMLHKKCQASDRQLKLCGVSPENRIALNIVRFDSLVDIYEGKPQAIAAFKIDELDSVEVDVDEGSAEEDLAQATAGDLDAQFRYGKCLETGRGVAQDFEAALKWYEKAADQGHAESEHALGVAYAYGLGVPQDFDVAFDWYKKAADLGHADAQYWIGVSLQHGLIDKIDIPRAIKWYNEAAEQGYEPARQAIAELRRGTPSD